MTQGLAALRVTICGIPELDEHRAAGVTHVVSILDPQTPEPPAFAGFPPHDRLGLRFHDIIDPEPGGRLPAEEDVQRLLAFGRALPATPTVHLLVHCHAGVSRSTAAAALILAQAQPERPATEAFGRVAALRPRAWPNLRLLELGDRLLGRDGEIVAAAALFYRRALAREPYLNGAMVDGGRGREVAAALGAPDTR